MALTKISGNVVQQNNFNLTGIVTATSFTGDLTGDVTGDVTGDLTGNVTGNVSSSGANTLGSLSVTNDATVGGALTVTGNLTVNGTTTTIDTVVTAIDTLAVDGDVTAGGNLNITGVSTFGGNIDLGDNDRLRLGDSQDLQIYHTGSDSVIQDTGVGNLFLAGDNDLWITNSNFSENKARFITNGAVELYYDNSKKFETTGFGVTVAGGVYVSGVSTFQGNVYLGDGDKLRFGAGPDLQIYHNGSHSYIDETGTGNLYIRNGTKNSIWCQSDGQVNLYHNDNKKFETTNSGVVVTGIVTAIGTANSITVNPDLEYPTIRPTLDLNFAATKTLDRRITFTRDSIGTYVDELGIIRTAPNNTPRFDHDPATGESLGLLIEESRTNYFDYSESTTWQDYTGGQTSLENSTLGILSPTGSTPLVIRPTNTSLTSLLNDRYEAYPSSGGTMIFSVFVKTPPGSQYEEVQLYASAVTTGNFTASLIFNISTLTTRGAVGTAANAGIFDYGNGWYRVCMSFTCPASTSGPIQRVTIVDDAVAQGTTQSDGLLIFGYQLELGSFATSYIPTSGSTVTRAADFAKITGTNFTDFYGNTDHSFFVDFDLKNTTSTDSMAILTLPSATYPWLLYRYVDDYWKSYNGSDSIVNVSSTYSQTNNRFAFAIGSSNGSSAYNGSLTQTDQSALRTGLYSNASSILLFTRGTDFIPSGYLKQLKYYPKRLPNAQLQGLTAQ